MIMKNNKYARTRNEKNLMKAFARHILDVYKRQIYARARMDI